ncbi:MAG TPA: GDP-L-fucose synthase [Methanomassiliicoccales archaeon]|nr:GDP-L-fucose synthase [Methanomassiliicoccales archaeon]
MSFLEDKRVAVTGGAGFLGRHVVQQLKARGVEDKNIVVPRSKRFDLRRWEDCQKVCAGADIVIHLAAKVGGIGFNRRNPATLFYDNAIMGIQLMEAARQAGVGKYVTVATVCSYPKFTHVPFKEEEIWNGYPEETNAPYGIAKKNQFVQADAYRRQYGFNAIVLVPVNLYGPYDNFDLEDSHVVPALIRKMIEARRTNARTVELWGTGSASREFLYVDDCAQGIVLATERYNSSEPVNLGTGVEIKIKDLAELIKGLTGYEGKIVWDPSKPDGQPRRCLDVSRAKERFGFEARTSFEYGLKKTIAWYENAFPK